MWSVLVIRNKRCTMSCTTFWPGPIAQVDIQCTSGLAIHVSRRNRPFGTVMPPVLTSLYVHCTPKRIGKLWALVESLGYMKQG